MTGVQTCALPISSTTAAVPGAVVEENEDAISGTVQLVLGSDFNAVGEAVDAAPPAAGVEGEDARTAADTSCIY